MSKVNYTNLPFINKTGKNLISSEYGRRTLGSGFHRGVDFALASGTQIVSVADGKVILAITNNSTFGGLIIIQHGDGALSLYGHLSKVSITEGTLVNANQIIGLSGNTGSASKGAHLHFSMLDGNKVINGETVAHIIESQSNMTIRETDAGAFNPRIKLEDLFPATVQAQDSTVDVEGDSRDNTLIGNSKNNYLFDTRGGEDALYAKEGNDILAGGAGSDILDGGAGSDTFILQDDGGIDIIYEVSEAKSINHLYWYGKTNIPSPNTNLLNKLVSGSLKYFNSEAGGYWRKTVGGDELTFKYSLGNSGAVGKDLQIFKGDDLVAVVKDYKNDSFDFRLQKGDASFNPKNFSDKIGAGSNGVSFADFKAPEFKENISPSLNLPQNGLGFYIKPYLDQDFKISADFQLPTTSLINKIGFALTDLSFLDLAIPDLGDQGADMKLALAELSEFENRLYYGKNLMSSLLYFATSKGKTATGYLDEMADLAGLDRVVNREEFGNFYQQNFSEKYDIPLADVKAEVTDTGVNFEVKNASGEYSINYVDGVPVLVMDRFEGEITARLTQLGINDQFLSKLGITEIKIPDLAPIKIYRLENPNFDISKYAPNVDLHSLGKNFGSVTLIDSAVQANLLGNVSVNVSQFLDSLNGQLDSLQKWISDSSSKIAGTIYLDDNTKNVIADVLNEWAKNPEAPLTEVLEQYAARKLTDHVVSEIAKMMFPEASDPSSMRGKVETAFMNFAATSMQSWLEGKSFDLGERLSNEATNFVQSNTQEFLKTQLTQAIQQNIFTETVGGQPTLSAQMGSQMAAAAIFAIASALLSGAEAGVVASNAIVAIVSTVVSSSVAAAFAQLGAFAGPLGAIAGALIGAVLGPILFRQEVYYHDTRTWDGSLLLNLSDEGNGFGQMTFIADRKEGATYQLPDADLIYHGASQAGDKYVTDDPNYDGVKIYAESDYFSQNSTVGDSFKLNISASGTDIIMGGVGDDVWIGNNRSNVIMAGSGDDLVLGQGGADYIYGGAGDDHLEGGDGNDIIYADVSDPTQGRNKIWTVQGVTTLEFKGQGDDVLKGDAGDDYLIGGIGRDIFLGGDGNDSVSVINGYDYDSEIIYKYQRDDKTAYLADGKQAIISNASNGSISLSIAGVSHQILAGDYTQLMNYGGSVAALSDGNLVVSWQAQIISNYTTLPNGNVSYSSKYVNYTQVFNSQGQALTEILKSDLFDGGFDSNSVSVAALKDGGFVVAWKEASLEQRSYAGGVDSWFNNKLYFAVFDASYHPLTTSSGSAAVTYSRTNSAIDPEVVALENGGFIIAWNKGENNTEDKSSYLAQEFDKSGNKLGSEFSNVQNWYEKGFNGDTDVVFGEAGNDILTGDNESNVMDGGADNDQISGGGGDDELRGGVGDDYLKGDAGKDILSGGAGDDIIEGGDDSDILLDGGAGDDIIYGGAGNDVIMGGDGDDNLAGGDGDDILFADSGNDQLVGGEGKDLYIVDLSKANAFIQDGSALNDLFLANTDLGNLRIFQDIDDLLIIDTYSQKSVRIDGGAYVPKVNNLYLADGYKIDLTKINFSFFGEGEFTVSSSDNAAFEVAYENLLELHEEKVGDYGIAIPQEQQNWGALNYFTEVAQENLNQINNSVEHGYQKQQRVNGSLFGYDIHHYYYDIYPQLLEGTAAADRLIGAYWGEAVNGGAGNDVIYGAAGNDNIQGGDGNDVISGNSGNDIIDGGTGHDLLSGDIGRDVISGGAGNDMIYGLADNDNIDGGAGEDYISGGLDNDNIQGGDGNDLILGDEGDDVIYAGNGNDVTWGGKGDDKIYGDLGNDYLVGEEGRDLIDGGDGDDILIGGSGEDIIYSGRGNNIVQGGSEADVIDAKISSGNNQLEGGTGDDKIYGGSGTNNIEGNSGNDYIELSGGVSTVLGGMGDDEIIVKSGKNFTDGGSGLDKLNYSTFAAALTISSISTENSQSSDYSYKSIESLTTTSYNDIIYAGSEDAEIHSGSGNDNIFGGSGSEVIFGGDGDDVIRGGLGTNILVGGEGSDTFVISNRDYEIYSEMGYGWSVYSVKGLDLFDVGDTISDFDVTKDKIDLTAFTYLRSIKDINLGYQYLESNRGSFSDIGFRMDGEQLVPYSQNGNFVNRQELENHFLQYANLWNRLMADGYITDDVGDGAHINVDKIRNYYATGVMDEIDDVMNYLASIDDYDGKTVYNNWLSITTKNISDQLTEANFIFANSAPIANSDEFYLKQGDALSFVAGDLIKNDSDRDAFGFTNIDLAVGSGTLTWQLDGSLKYQADADVSGITSTSYTITDSHGTVSTGVIKFYIVPQFEVANFRYIQNPNEILTISKDDLIANDTEFSGFDFTISGSFTTPNGTVVTKVGDDYQFEFASGVKGLTTLSYDITDANLQFKTTQTVEVYINSAPIDLGENAILQEDGNITLDVMANASDDEEIFLDQIVTNPQHGTASIQDGKIFYQASANYYGSDSLTYRVIDEYGAYTDSTVNFTINSVEDGPSKISSATNSIDIHAYDYFEKDLTFAGREFVNGQWNYISKYFDAENDKLSFNIKLADGSPLPAWVHLEQRAFSDWAKMPDFLTNDIVLVGHADATAPAKLDLILEVSSTGKDGVTRVFADNIMLNVAQPNLPVTDHFTTNEEQSLFFTEAQLTANDPSGDIFRYMDYNALHGVVEWTGSGYKYTPNKDFYGTETLRYNVDYQYGESVFQRTRVYGEIDIDVRNVNDAPTISNNKFVVINGKVTDFDLGLKDVEGDVVTITSVSGGVNQYSINAGKIRVNAATIGEENLLVSIRDANGAVVSQNINVTTVSDRGISNYLDSLDVVYAKSLTDFSLDLAPDDGIFADGFKIVVNGIENVSWLKYDVLTGKISGKASYQDLFSNSDLVAELWYKGSKVQDYDFSTKVVSNMSDMATKLTDQVAYIDQNFHLNLDEKFQDQENFISYNLTLANGAALPTWLNFNQTTGLLSGAVPANAAKITNFHLEATAANGEKVTKDFKLNVENFSSLDWVAGSGNNATFTQLSNGNIAVVWRADGTNIVGKILASDGMEIIPQFTVFKVASGLIASPKIEALASGGFVAVFDAKDYSVADLFYLNGIKFDNYGKVQGSAFKIDTYGDEYSYTYDVKAISTDLIATTKVAYSDNKIQTSIISVTSKEVIAQTILEYAISGDPYDMALSASGKLNLIWENSGNIYTKSFTNNFTAVRTLISDLGNVTGLRSTNISEDKIAIATLTDSKISLYYLDTVTNILSNVAVAANAVSFRYLSDVTVTDNGLIGISWHERVTEYDKYSSYMQFFKSNGDVASGKIRLNDKISNDSFRPSLIDIGDNQLIAYWNDTTSGKIMAKTVDTTALDKLPLIPFSDYSSEVSKAVNITIPSGAFSGSTFTYNVTLDNGDPLPSWLSFYAATKTISGTPPTGAQGKYDLLVTVINELGNIAVDTFTVDVANNTPTTNSSVANVSLDFSEAVFIKLPDNLFSDKDGDALTVTLTAKDGSAVDWLSLDWANKKITGLAANAGNYDFVLKAKDAFGAETQSSFAVNVLPKNYLGNEHVVNTTRDEIEYDPESVVLSDNSKIYAWHNGAEVKVRILDQKDQQFAANISLASGNIKDVEIVALASGNALLAWRDGNNIYSQEINKSGVAVTSKLLISSSASYSANQGFEKISLTELSNGERLVSWSSGTSPMTGGVMSIYTQKFSASALLGSTVAVSGDAVMSNIVGLAGGKYAVSFLNITNFLEGNSGEWSGSGKIVLKIFNADGSAVTSLLDVDSATLFDLGALKMKPDIIKSPDGSFIVTYQDYTKYNSSYDSGIYAKRFDASGNVVTSAFKLISTTASTDYLAPQIAWISSDYMVAVWGEGSSTYKVYGRYFDKNGNAIGEKFLISDDYVGDKNIAPTVQVNSAREVVVSWQGLDAVSGKSAIISETIDPHFFPNALQTEVKLQPFRDEQFSYNLLKGVFADTVFTENLTVTLANGAALPSWLSFSSATGILSGNVTDQSIQSLALKLNIGAGTFANQININFAPEARFISNPTSTIVNNTIYSDVKKLSDGITLLTVDKNIYFLAEDSSTIRKVAIEGAANIKMEVINSNDILTYYEKGSSKYIQHLNAKGEAINQEIALNISVSSNSASSRDQLVNLGNGKILVAYVSGNDVTGRIFDLYTGEAKTSAFGISSHYHYDYGHKLVSAKDGTFFAVWQSEYQESQNVSDRLGIYLKKFSDSGNALTDLIHVNTTIIGAQNNPDIAIAPDSGKIMVSWSSVGDTYFKIYNSLGVELVSETKISNGSASASSNTIQAIAGDRFLANWFSGGKSYAQIIDDEGVFIGSPITTSNSNFVVDTVALGDNKFMQIMRDTSSSNTFVTSFSNDIPLVNSKINNSTTYADSDFSLTLPTTLFADAQDGTLSYSLSGIPSWISYNQATKTLTGKASASDVGEYNIAAIATDSNGNQVTKQILLTVTEPNKAPEIIQEISDQAINEGEALTLNLANVFSDLGSNNDYNLIIKQITASGLVTMPAWLVLNGKTLISGITDDAQVGSYNLRLTATDSSGLATAMDFYLNVFNKNDAPTLSFNNFATAEDQELLINLSSYVSDADGDVLTFAITASPLHASAFIDANNILHYTASANYFGSDYLAISATDAAAIVVSASISINVSSVNDAPILAASTINQAISEDGTFTIDLLANVSDVENNVLTISQITAAYGVLTVLNGKVTYAANANYNGLDNISYTISDANGGVAQGNVAITIAAVDDAPILTVNQVNLSEDSALVIDVLAGATDAENSALQITSFGQGSNGTVVLENGKLKYTPFSNFNGVDLVAYEVSDGVNSTTQTISINVNSVNDNPTAITQIVMAEDRQTKISIRDLASDIEDLNLALSSIQANDSNIIISRNGSDIFITPANNFYGKSAFTFTAIDSSGGSVTQVVEVTVNSVNDAPVVNLVEINSSEDQVLQIDLLANAADVDGDSLTIVSASANGVVEIVNNKLSYQPTNNFYGADRIDYVVTDGKGGVVQGSLKVNVVAVNDAPILNVNNASLNEDSSVLIDVLAGAIDVEGDNLQITNFSQGSSGAVTLENGKLKYIPSNNFNGADKITYEISDGVNRISQEISINVNPVSDAPLIEEMTPIIYEETHVNSYKIGRQYNSSIIALKDGGWLVAWDSLDQDGSAYGVYAQRYSSSNQAVGSEFRINSYSSNNQNNVAITALEDGGWVASWQSVGQDGSSYGIYAQRYASSGQTVGAESKVNSYTSGIQSTPSIAALKDGGWVISWQSNLQDGSGYGIYAQRFASDGQAVGAELRVNSYTNSDQNSPSIAALSDGGWVISWDSLGQDGASYYGIYAQRYASTGQAVGAEFKVNSYITNQQKVQAITGLNDGGWVVAWESNSQDGSGYGVYAQRYSSAGQAVGTEFRVNSATQYDQNYSSITALKDGGWLVSWTSAEDIYAKRYASNGQVVGDEFRVNTYAANEQYLPAVAALDDGGWLISWSSYGQDGQSSSYDFGVSYQRYAADGTTSVATTPLHFSATTNSLSVNEDTISNVIAINAIDDDGDVLTYSIKAGFLPQKGVVTFNQAAGTYSYTPNSNQNGSDSFTILISDGKSGAAEFVVNATINAINDAPVVTAALTNKIANEESLFEFTIPNNSFSDVDDATLTLTAKLSDGSNLPSWLSFDGTKFSGTPLHANVGSNLDVKVTATDALGAHAESSFILNVNKVNHAPIFEVSTSNSYAETAVNEYKNNSQSASVITTLKDGGWLVTWQSDGQDGSDFGIYAKRYASNGQAVGDEFKVNSFTDTNQISPAIAALEDGGWLVTWQFRDKTYSASSNAYSIYAQRYSSNGQAVGDEVKINDAATSLGNSRENSAVVGLPDGGWLISYDGYARNGIKYITVKHYASDGTMVGSEINPYYSSNSLNQTFSSIASLKDGGWIVAWEFYGLGFGSSGNIPPAGIYARRYSSSGQAIGSEFIINSDLSDRKSSPSIVALNDGGWLASWTSSDQDGSEAGIYAKRYSSDGSVVGNEFKVNSYVSGEQSNSSITALKDGGWIISWQSAAEDGSGLGIYAQRYSSNGQTFGAEFKINNYTNGDQSSPSITALDDGGWLVSWTSDGQDGSGGGIYFQRYFADGVTTHTTTVVTSTAVAALTLSEDSSSGVIATNAVDIDGDVLAYSLKAEFLPQKGVVTFNQAAGTYSYIPNSNQNGGDSFTILVSDGVGGVTEIVVSVAIQSINDAPVLSVALTNKSINEDSLFEFTIPNNSFTDVDEALTLTAKLADGSDLPSWLSFNGEKFSGTPLNANVGNLNVKVIATDSFGAHAESTFNLNINNVNDAPIFEVLTPVIYSETQVNSYANGNQQSSAIAALKDGGWIVSWESYAQDGSSYAVYAKRYASNGQALGGEFRVNTYTDSEQWGSAITVLKDGGWLISWQSSGQDGSSSGVYAQRYSSNAQAVGGEFRINSYTNNNQSGVAVTALTDGGWLAAWMSDTQDGSGYGVYAQRYSSSGQVVDGEFRINNYTSDYQYSPVIAALQDGGWVATWTSENQDGSFSGVYAKRYSNNGQAFGNEFLVNSYTAGAQEAPVITALNDGGWIISWSSIGQDGSYAGIFAQRYASDGQTVGAEFRVNSYTNSAQLYSSITALSDGGWVISWQSHLQDGSDYGIYAQRYSSDGQTVGGEFRVNSYTNDAQFYSAITGLNDGGWVISWDSYGQDRYDGRGIFFQRFAADGTVIKTVTTVTSATTSTLVIDEDSTSNSIVIGAIDGDDDVLTYSLKSGFLPKKGVVTFDQAAGTYSYIPNLNQNGGDGFTILISDSHGGVAELVVNALIKPVNDSPTASLTAITTGKNHPINIDILSAASDIDGGDNLTIKSVTNGAHGAVAIGLDSEGKQIIIYTPRPNYSGTDKFNYSISDNKGGLVTKELTVTIDDNGATENDPFTVNEDTSTTIDFANIALENNLIFTNPLHGSISVNYENKTITYTPNKNYNGTDSISYQIQDSSFAGSIKLTILPVYDPIKINYSVGTKQAQINKEFTYKIDGAWIKNTDNNNLQITIKSSDGSELPSWLSFDQDSLELRGTPLVGSYGLKTFLITISDGITTNETTLNLTIDQALQAKEGANIIQATQPTNNDEANVVALEGSEDLIMGSDENDVVQYAADETWSDAFMAYNPYSDDLFSVSGKQRSFDAFDGQGGSDSIKLTNFDDGLFLDDLFSSNPSESGSRLFGIETINGANGDDIIDLSSFEFTYGDVTINGGNGNDVLWGNDGNDTINGDDGEDHIVGGRGDDIMTGGDGNDIIKGYDGDDTLVGGGGSDILSGGNGSDIFTFSNLSDSTINYSDLISDFTKGEDIINISALNFTSISTNSTTSDILVYYYDEGNNTTVIEDSSHNFVIKLTGNVELDEGDFNFG